MRYFTLELFRALSGDPAGAEAWGNEEWNQRTTRYREELERVRAKFPERLSTFLDQGSLYEYHVERITTFGIEPDPVMQVRYTLEVEIELSFGEETRRLMYKKVQRVSLDLDAGSPLMRSAAPSSTLSTDTWLYDEFSVVSPNRLRHEVLLASGGRFLVEFEDFDYDINTPGAKDTNP